MRREFDSFFLIFFKASLGLSEEWSVESAWHVNSQKKYSTTLQAPVSSVSCKDGASLVFPNVMHSFQEVSIDGKIVYKYGDIKTEYIRSIYGSPVIPCEFVKGEKITWTIISPFKFFAKINGMPHVSGHTDTINKSEVKHLMIYGALFVFGLMLLFGLKTKSLYTQSNYLGLFSMCMSLFFLSSVLGLVGIKINVLLVDKMAATSLGFATLFYISFLYARGLLSKRIYSIFRFVIVPGTVVIPFLPTGDSIQALLNIIFAPAVLSTWISLYSETKDSFLNKSKFRVLDVIALSFFAAAATSDVAYTFGIHSQGMMLGYGVLGTVLFFTRSIQKEVAIIYHEREYLRKNLELEVDKKTTELKNKTAALEVAIHDLKTAQAELVQSAKLASIGTLAAGIAHEINNSINYVNGALIPLERIIEKNSFDEAGKEKLSRLLQVMKDGLSLTINIIKSLRNYTGLNHAVCNDIKLYELVDSILSILKNRLHNKIRVSVDINKDLIIFANTVGLNQIMMNLISNAVDSMPNGGDLSISAKGDGERVIICVADSGGGIPEEIRARIFDPFFTTKRVGQGMGLGLHIVLNEIKKHHGSIDVSTEVGVGTKFTISIPISVNKPQEGAA